MTQQERLDIYIWSAEVGDTRTLNFETNRPNAALIEMGTLLVGAIAPNQMYRFVIVDGMISVLMTDEMVTQRSSLLAVLDLVTRLVADHFDRNFETETWVSYSDEMIAHLAKLAHIEHPSHKKVALSSSEEVPLSSSEEPQGRLLHLVRP